MNKKLRRNQEIKAPQVRIIYGDKNLGIVSTPIALEQAKKFGLDLVEISPDANPPVCKIIDWGKFNYEESKKNKNKETVKNHEVKFGVNIDEHDLQTKLSIVERFLESGDRVKITIKFKGRQNAHPELGFDLATRIVDSIQKISNTEPKLNGKSIMFHIERK
jgi:translation initiation factor IF-3